MIEKIIAEEAEAEAVVAEAVEEAQKAKAALEERNRETFDGLQEDLVDERTKAAEKVKAEARAFKDEVAESLRKDIERLNDGSDRRIAQAVSAVVTRFKEYVGK